MPAVRRQSLSDRDSAPLSGPGLQRSDKGILSARPHPRSKHLDPQNPVNRAEPDLPERGNRLYCWRMQNCLQRWSCLALLALTVLVPIAAAHAKEVLNWNT